VPSSIWDHAGPLGSDAWQQVRLHAYHSEQVLCRSPALAEIGRLAGLHHERLDGTGYHRGIGAAQLSAPARVLAAADTFSALVSERAHRPAYSRERAEAELASLVKAGALDGDVVSAVVADDPRSAPRRVRPAGLTDRQLDVLRLVARGLSNREIGTALVISPRTAERHVQDVYQRIGVSSRAAAAMFAMQRGLL
jgi:DNA-binding NarL/FixJ family response regulator